ncbi:MAG: tetratricopeptide repeat protein [Caldisericaceae bacterium]|nr:tetratricopeptide repeat protein [Caldisericaceae bacterium]
MRWLIISLLAFGLFQGAMADSIRSKINKGNEYFKQGKYEQALAQYQDALLDDPLNEIAIFNKGNAFYKLKKYKEAIDAYQKVVGSENLDLSAKAFYNIGNCYFQQNKLKESIEAYKKALELKPDDYQAKYNLELARAKLKEMADKQQQQPNQQNKNIEPSEFAKKLKEQAEKLVDQRRYNDAYQLMMDGLKKDKTVAAFRNFIQRIKDVVDILGSQET